MSTKQTFRQAKTYVASRTFMQTDPGIRDVLRPERPGTPVDRSRPVSRERGRAIGFRSMGHSLAVP